MQKLEPRPRQERTRHEGLKAWQSAQALTLEIYRITKLWPSEERYGLIAQIRRAAVSVSANIAEGSAKRGPREFRRFLDMSLGSLAEIHVYLLLAKELDFVTPAEWGQLEALRDHTGRLIWGLSRAILKRPPREGLA
jgi:four helix bundle protein